MAKARSTISEKAKLSSASKAMHTKKAKFRTVSMPSRPTSKAIPPPDKVSIEVLLQPSDLGLSPTEAMENISFSNIDSFRPAKATRDQAAARLSDMGFKVVAISPYSISIEGTPSLFTKTFGTDLEIRSIERNQNSRPMREKAFYAPAVQATWNAPVELADVIHRAYIQPPAIYFESALPPSVKYFHLTVPSDVALLMGASDVHHLGITGKGVKVVMIDSGFFKHRYYQRHGFESTVMLAPDANNPDRDENGHGTAEAANIFANAPDITFTMVKQGNNSTAAFKTAVALKPDIITCSWGFDLVDPASSNRKHLKKVPNFLKALELEVARAVANGIVVIFSAGNGHVSFPGMHPDVISAGGVFIDQDESLKASDYASAFDSKPFPGRHVPDVCGLVGMQPHAIYIMLPLQPGCEIDTELSSGGSFPNSDETKSGDGWSAISGTSAAAPQLAGVCALLKQKNPHLTPQQVKQALLASAKDCTKGKANSASNEGVALRATTGIDGATGHGLVDAAEAIKLV